MLGKLKAWLEDHRRWSEDHRASWAGMTEPGSDGLTELQRVTERAVRDFVRDRSLSYTDRRFVRIGEDEENYVVAEVPELDAEIWMYRDQTNIETSDHDFRMEEWDARTPKEHLDSVIDFLDSLYVSTGQNE